MCFFKEQALALLKENHFEVDMGFKRVRDPNINEIVLAKYLGDIRRGSILSITCFKHITNMFSFYFRSHFCQWKI